MSFLNLVNSNIQNVKRLKILNKDVQLYLDDPLENDLLQDELAILQSFFLPAVKPRNARLGVIRHISRLPYSSRDFYYNIQYNNFFFEHNNWYISYLLEIDNDLLNYEEHLNLLKYILFSFVLGSNLLFKLRIYSDFRFYNYIHDVSKSIWFRECKIISNSSRQIFRIEYEKFGKWVIWENYIPLIFFNFLKKKFWSIENWKDISVIRTLLIYLFSSILLKLVRGPLDYLLPNDYFLFLGSCIYDSFIHISFIYIKNEWYRYCFEGKDWDYGFNCTYWYEDTGKWLYEKMLSKFPKLYKGWSLFLSYDGNIKEHLSFEHKLVQKALLQMRRERGDKECQDRSLLPLSYYFNYTAKSWNYVRIVEEFAELNIDKKKYNWWVDSYPKIYACVDDWDYFWFVDKNFFILQYNWKCNNSIFKWISYLWYIRKFSLFSILIDQYDVLLFNKKVKNYYFQNIFENYLKLGFSSFNYNDYMFNYNYYLIYYLDEDNLNKKIFKKNFLDRFGSRKKFKIRKKPSTSNYKFDSFYKPNNVRDGSMVVNKNGEWFLNDLSAFENESYKSLVQYDSLHEYKSKYDFAWYEEENVNLLKKELRKIEEKKKKVLNFEAKRKEAKRKEAQRRYFFGDDYYSDSNPLKKVEKKYLQLVNGGYYMSKSYRFNDFELSFENDNFYPWKWF